MTVENSNTFRRPALRNINVIDAEVKCRFLNAARNTRESFVKFRVKEAGQRKEHGRMQMLH